MEKDLIRSRLQRIEGATATRETNLAEQERAVISLERELEAAR